MSFLGKGTTLQDSRARSAPASRLISEFNAGKNVHFHGAAQKALSIVPDQNAIQKTLNRNYRADIKIAIRNTVRVRGPIYLSPPIFSSVFCSSAWRSFVDCHTLKFF